MRSGLKYIAFVLVLCLGGCEQQERVENFFRPVPVLPLEGIIKTCLPVGYCSMIAAADQLGYSIPYEKLRAGNGFTLIRIQPSGEYPLIYLDETIGEILVLRFPANDEAMILSIIVTHNNWQEIPGRIIELNNVPVIIEDGKVTAVFVSQDIYVRDSVELDLHMGPGNIQIALDRLETPRPAAAVTAIDQNAWIIDADPSGTWDQHWDDQYVITGGEQDVSAITGETGTGSGILQLAMIGTVLGPGCITTPTGGFAVLHEIGVETGSESVVNDLVVGTVFYNFKEDCTGRVLVPLATGNYITSTGKTIRMDLLE
jgi:hypothetical protein